MTKVIGSLRLGYLWTQIKAYIAGKKYAGGTADGGTANKAASIPFGTVDSTSVATAFTATVDGITELRDGVCVYLKNTVVTSAAATTAPKCFTLNINGLGAKPVYQVTAAASYATTHFTKNYKYLFTYDSSLNSGDGGWYIGQIFNSNTTYSDMTQAEITAGTGTTGRKITPKMLRDNFYTEDEVDALIPTVPTKVSDLTNDSGFITGYTETDPTVPAWAKAANKPSYTAAEVGALPDTYTAPVTSVNGQTGAVVVSPASPTSTTPAMDGVANVGSETTFAKGDHVHPSDTSREARVTTVNHGTSDTTFALTPNVLHTWGTVNSLTLTLASGSSTYVDGYWFKFTAGSSFTALTMPSGVDWVTEPEIEAGKTYEVMIVDGLASYVTDGIGDSIKAKTRIVNHGTSDTTYQLAPNEFHIWGEVASLTLTLLDESSNYVDGYWFRFTCGNTPTVLTLPSSVEWYYEDVTFEANHTYEVTIVEGKACYTDYASTTQIATKQWVEDYVDEHGSSSGGNVSSTTVNTIVSLTEAEYTALTTKDSSTLYIITSS